ncbi:hypothetical protein [Microbispora sp. ATCC PTA-5024]|nr:hypothetical protein [Microbispora sp. ATCC PTA-5024]ETK34607.1 hypothetical protein MPTA5024_18430 [Microbispora sp. ATCC PTA-5024]
MEHVEPAIQDEPAAAEEPAPTRISIRLLDKIETTNTYSGNSNS